MANLPTETPGSESVPVKRFRTGAHRWHIEVMRARDYEKRRYFVLEWHRRARKTSLILNLLIRDCCAAPDRVCPYIGPTYKQAKKIAWLDPNMLFKFLPPKDHPQLGWEDNKTDLFIHFKNGSMLPILGGDDPDSLRGLDAHCVGFDEWDLMKEWIWPEIFRPIIGLSSERWAMFGYTPKGDHAATMFDRAACIDQGFGLPTDGRAEKLRDEWFASRLTATESGIITPVELAKIKEETPLAIFQQEYLCSRLSEQERTLVTSAAMQGLEGLDWAMTRMCYPETRKIVSIDPAFGGDLCDMKGLQNTRIVEHKTFHPHMKQEIVAEAKMMAQNMGTKNFIIDCIGIGKPIADDLQGDAAEYNVQYFNSAEKPTDAPTKKGDKVSIFANKRAQVAFYVAAEVRAARVEAISEAKIPEKSKIELLRQIPVATRYKTNGRGQVLMQPKDKAKDILNCSPDSYDSWAQGIWGLQFVDPVSSAQTYAETPSSGVYIPQTVGAR